MKMFLSSKASHPESIEKLKNFVGDNFENKKVVYIPTAQNGTKWGKWKKGNSIKIVKSLWKDLTVVQLEDVGEDQSIEEVIGEPDILWVAGGMPGYLLYWIRRTKLDIYLSKILESGTIYVGSSAGSMICAKTNYLAEIFPDEEEPGAALLPGLGYMKHEICPHYEEKYLEKLKKSWNKDDLYLLKDGEVITLVDNEITILGEKRMLSASELVS